MKRSSLKIIRRQVPQSVVNFGEAGLKRDDPDWYAAYVMNYILGGGSFSSHLMTEVRVKRGLAYGAYTGLEPYAHGAVVAGVHKNFASAQSAMTRAKAKVYQPDPRAQIAPISRGYARKPTAL